MIEHRTRKHPGVPWSPWKSGYPALLPTRFRIKPTELTLLGLADGTQVELRPKQRTCVDCDAPIEDGQTFAFVPSDGYRHVFCGAVMDRYYDATKGS